ncbi:MAG: hypothetical protein KBG48_35770 [Kofleriaceae bacterium]|nr:hypothetical protein [Kofleriaceae bacterium]MBP9172774.1 hypothetical protein [Kofleriaceae bacterium]MBP9862373.1 hypothetical protein [Kofleriaceae bacterium]
MTDLSPDTRDLLAAARAELAPDPAALERGRRRLAAATATAAVGGAAAARAASGGKVAALGLGVAAAVAIAVVAAPPWTRGRRTSAPAPAVAPAVPEAAPPAVAPSAGTAPALAPTAPAVPAVPELPAIDLADIVLESPRPRPPRPASASASSPSAAPLPPAADLPADPPTISPPVAADPLTRELAHLRAARTALRAGDPGAAEAALTSYRAEFAAGQLAEEAGALAVEVRCAAGDPAGAERARATFLRRWPTSTARARVLGLCPGR